METSNTIKFIESRILDENTIIVRHNDEYFKKLFKLPHRNSSNLASNEHSIGARYPLCQICIELSSGSKIACIKFSNIIKLFSGFSVDARHDNEFMENGKIYENLTKFRVDELIYNIGKINEFLTNEYNKNLKKFNENKTTPVEQNDEINNFDINLMKITRVEEKLQHFRVYIPDLLENMIEKHGVNYITLNGGLTFSRKMLSLKVNNVQFRIVFRKNSETAVFEINDDESIVLLKFGQAYTFSTETNCIEWVNTEKNAENLLLLEQLFESLQKWYGEKKSVKDEKKSKKKTEKQRKKLELFERLKKAKLE